MNAAAAVSVVSLELDLIRLQNVSLFWNSFCNFLMFAVLSVTLPLKSSSRVSRRASFYP
jgi:hypothetical protein